MYAMGAVKHLPFFLVSSNSIIYLEILILYANFVFSIGIDIDQFLE